MLNYSFEHCLRRWLSFEKLMKMCAENNTHNAELHFNEAKSCIEAISFAITVLSEDELLVIYEFYHENKKVDQICVEHSFSRSQYYRIRGKALSKMEGFSDMLNIEK